jgi:hypothetical protein
MISKLPINYRQVLARVLKYCQVTLDCLKEAGVTVTLQRRAEHEAAHYCSVCEVLHLISFAQFILLIYKPVSEISKIVRLSIITRFL